MGGRSYRSLKIPGGAGIHRRKRIRHLIQKGRGAKLNFLKKVAKSAGKALLRQGVNNLGNIVNTLGSSTRHGVYEG